MNKYRVIIRGKEDGTTELEFYRFSTKGLYKNEWEMLLIARDKTYKELKLNKHWFIKDRVIDIAYLEEIE